MIKSIASTEDIRLLRASVMDNLEKSYLTLRELTSSTDSFSAFSKIRFNKIALDPLNGSPLNFVEMLNQTFSDLVVLYGAEYLAKNHPGHVFTARLGVESGNDIESEDGTIIAECFAVTQMKSNDKLKKDIKKLLKLENSTKKYIFFYSENDIDEKISNLTKNYPEVNCIRVSDFEQSL